MDAFAKPGEIFKDVVIGLEDIIWWNRHLTKLHNYLDEPSSVKKFILQYSGPFIEKVRPPAVYGGDKPINWEEFALQNGMEEEVIQSVKKVLFKGQSLPLYHHQAEATQHLCGKATACGEDSDVIISVPTATGKTESFFLGILDWCVRRRKEILRAHGISIHSLKALIIYPMKTLGIDQLNRFIEYTYEVNTILAEKRMPLIRVGVWDGDTPNNVNTGAEIDDEYYGGLVLPGDHARGLKCPVHSDEPLLYRNSAEVTCPRGDWFNWIAVTRQDILSKGVDILVSNPEAMEYLLIHPYKKRLLQSADLKYIVVDEAHIWSGSYGSSFALFLKRIKNLGTGSRPRVVLSTATVKNPLEFSKKILGTSNIRHISYRGRLDHISPQEIGLISDIKRIQPTNFRSIMLLIIAQFFSNQPDPNALFTTLDNQLGKEEFDNALYTAKILGLLDTSAKLTTEGVRLCQGISTAATADYDASIAQCLSSQTFTQQWGEIISKKLPEIFYLSEVIMGEGDFHEEAAIALKLEGEGIKYLGSDILYTLLSLGRASDFLFDKYHFFIKPPSSLFYCPECRSLSLTAECPSRIEDHKAYELMFCTSCHEPGTLSEDGKKVNLLSTEDYCSCGKKAGRRGFGNAFLHYSTFTTYLLSLLPYKLKNPKVLVFGDGRQLIEHLGEMFQDLDYSLVADRIKLYLLLCTGGLNLYNLELEMRRYLFNIFMYETPLKVLRGTNLPEQLAGSLDKIYKLFSRSLIYMTQLNSRLLTPALISFEIANKYRDPIEKSFVHHLMAEIQLKSLHRGGGLGSEHVGYVPVSELKRAMDSFPGFEGILNEFERWLKTICQEVGWLIEREFQVGFELKDFREDHVFVPERSKSTLIFHVPDEVSYCNNCYRGYPAVLQNCPRCGSSMLSRGCRQKAGGWLKNVVQADFVLDHWAKDILAPALEYKQSHPVKEEGRRLQASGLNRLVALTHRAGIPQILRSAVEEGFRKDSPTVNIVCATPTMELGIDIGTLDCICQVGIPPTKTNYVQRSGRTGRRMITPSIIVNIVRNENAVDGHYMGDIYGRFISKQLRPLNIPEPTQSMVTSHIAAEVLRWLNFHPGSDYQNYYQIFPYDPAGRADFASRGIEELFNLVVMKLIRLSQDIVKYKDIIISQIFHLTGSQTLSEGFLHYIFYGKDSLIMTSVVELFEKLEGVYEQIKKDKVKENFIIENCVLGRLLQNIGIFPNFRGIGPSTMIYDAANKDIEMKPLSQALREGFPGPVEKGQIKQGAVWRMQTRAFAIKAAYVRKEPLNDRPVKICTNPDCDNPYEMFLKEDSVCPICKKELKEINIYPYWYGIGQPYSPRGFVKTIETQPLIRTIIEEV